jgi:hypothetical protein
VDADGLAVWLGLELDDPGFDFSVLSDFRARLIDHGIEKKILDLVIAPGTGWEYLASVSTPR